MPLYTLYESECRPISPSNWTADSYSFSLKGITPNKEELLEYWMRYRRSCRADLRAAPELNGRVNHQGDGLLYMSGPQLYYEPDRVFCVWIKEHTMEERYN